MEPLDFWARSCAAALSKISFPSSQESHLMPGGCLGRAVMPSESGKRQLVGGTVVALVLSTLLSWAAIYCLNRYLDPIDAAEQITGSVRHPAAD
jgi:hypothetical protein